MLYNEKFERFFLLTFVYSDKTEDYFLMKFGHHAISIFLHLRLGINKQMCCKNACLVVVIVHLISNE